jgi:DNA-binding transcriptional ArsR family regulator
VRKRTTDPAPDAYEALFVALAHPARRRILHTLLFNGGTMTAGEIAHIFDHTWPTTTRHLQVLEASGVIFHERKGRVRRYLLSTERLALARDWLSIFLDKP